MTLTHSDSNHASQIWGPQPETVSDYEILTLHGETTDRIVEVKGNYQRKRVHRFDARNASGIRLLVKGTHGSESARVFEIRVYETV